MDEIIVVADLGHFKAYGISKNSLEKSPRVELLKSYDAIAAHGKLGDKLSGPAGRFGADGGKKVIKGYGDPHNIELEIKRKLIKEIAENICGIIKKGKYKKWHLAASGNINNQILKNLDTAVKSMLDKNILSDLTKVHKSKILGYFE